MEFYQPYFINRLEAERFVSHCRQQRTPFDAAKRIMQQARRLVLIADDMNNVRKDRDALALLFYLTCAENAAKIHDGYSEDRNSAKYVQRFFAQFLGRGDQQLIGRAFTDENGNSLGLESSVRRFYKVRCSVAHEGKYWGFSFRDLAAYTKDVPEVHAQISKAEFRRIIVTGCVAAATDHIVD